jgi:hypothetical protein
LTAKEKAELAAVSQSAQAKLQGLVHSSSLSQRGISRFGTADFMFCLYSFCFPVHSPRVYQNINIPLASPSNLPLQMKTGLLQSSIYTSPAHALREMQPNCVPITHKAPSYIQGSPEHQPHPETPLEENEINPPPSPQPGGPSSANYHVGPTQVRNRVFIIQALHYFALIVLFSLFTG